ncbi:MAG: alkaline shock response membrane anchor protein AmaP, partial [Candidatus Omnitrophica bacterium]|nr:alkaline shock response membrane anchor protein AmaP [Candidatus Omnitrophota bacterium]
MRILGIIFYSTVIMLVGAALIMFAFGLSQPQDILDVLILMQGTTTSRAIVVISGILLILISFSFAQAILGRFQQEKTIAFNTSAGEVTIALTAVEDLIRRIAAEITEIRELRPNVIATKKGIIVDLRVVLRSEVNIPDMTARLQDVTRSKMQEILGIEEQIIIKI